MNEEQLAAALAKHLDAFLEGAPLPEAPPDEIAQLLAMPQSLLEITPLPRPEFGLALKDSLLASLAGNNGPMASAEPTHSVESAFGSRPLPIGWIGLFLLIAMLALLAGVIIFVITRPALPESPSPTPLPGQTQPVPTQSAPLPTPTPSTIEPAIPIQPTPAIASPTSTATAILDILPQVTITVASPEPLPLPATPAPGSGGGGSVESGNNGGPNHSGNGNNGDHDRGHGNDDDHYDDDNPGHKGGK